MQHALWFLGVSDPFYQTLNQVIHKYLPTTYMADAPPPAQMCGNLLCPQPAQEQVRKTQ